MTNRESKSLSLKKLGSIKHRERRTVSLPQGELVQSGYLSSGDLPLVLQPATAHIDLADWAEGNREWLENQLLMHGAILFRGFNINTPSAFERFSLTICQELFNENGEHPRQTISGNVYTPVFYPPDQKLLWHNENSFNHRWPRKILFGCRQPAEHGGETPLVDSCKVFEQLDPKIRERFIQKQVMYLRNYGAGFGLGWETVFHTSNPAEVEAVCRQALVDFEWKSRSCLRTRAVRPATVKHPITGKMAWFTQLQHWHPACLDPETRESLRSSFQEEDLPRNCYYGDGSLIEDTVVEEICAVYQQLEVNFSWQQADVLLLDNLLTAHGRNPFVGERKLLVAMGEMTSFDEI